LEKEKDRWRRGEKNSQSFYIRPTRREGNPRADSSVANTQGTRTRGKGRVKASAAPKKVKKEKERGARENNCSRQKELKDSRGKRQKTKPSRRKMGDHN